MTKYGPQLQDTLAVLMAMLYGQDDDGIDLFFTSSTTPHENLKTPADAVKLLTNAQPVGSMSTPHLRRSGISNPAIGKATDPGNIDKVLTHILFSQIGKDERYKRKLTLIILTDAVWPNTNDKNVVADKISVFLRAQASEYGNGKSLDDRYYSIQFVQFGNDKDGTAFLEYLDDGLSEDKAVP
jgi:hypothetical protein